MADNDSPLGGPLELPEDGAAGPHHTGGQHKKRRWPKKLLLLVVILIVLVGIGYGAGKLLSAHKKDMSASTTSTSTSATSNNKNDVPPVSDTKNYTSNDLNLTFTYPDNWTVNEANGGIRIESPTFTYSTTDKGSVTGNFRVYIRNGARDVDSKYIGRGVAAQDSKTITYTKPTATQRKTTSLSFFGLDTPDQFAYFLVAGNFDLKKGDTLGPNYGKEADTTLVTGGYSEKDLTDDFATNQVALNYFQTTQAYKQAVDIITSLQLQ